MIPLITLSHGSRKKSAAACITALTHEAGRMLETPAVEAHLELAEPSLDQVVATLSAEGVTRAALVPLLFSNAYHAKIDVPEAVKDASEKYGVELLVGPHLGTGSDVAGVLAQRLRADAPTDAHVILYSVGSSHVSANESVIDLAHTIALLTGFSVEVVPATGGPGAGGAGVIEVASKHKAVHILPLFVTEGLLLDRVIDQSANIAAATGTNFTYSEPLTTDLAPLVAARYHAALSALLAHI